MNRQQQLEQVLSAIVEAVDYFDLAKLAQWDIDPVDFMDTDQEKHDCCAYEWTLVVQLEQAIEQARALLAVAS